MLAGLGRTAAGGVVLLGLVGCSVAGDGGSGHTESPADRDTAEATLLTGVDLPGWTPRPDDDRHYDDEAARRCPLPKAVASPTGSADGPTFARFGGLRIGQQVYVFSDATDAQDALGFWASSQTRACFANLLRSRLPGESAPDESAPYEYGVTTGRALPIESVGEARAAVRISVPFRRSLIRGRVTLDIVVTRVGRGLSLLFFLRSLGPFDGDERGKVVTKSAWKLAARLSARLRPVETFDRTATRRGD